MPDPMSPDEFRAHLAALGLTINSFAHWLGLEPRNVRRWATGEVPVQPATVRLLRLMHFEGLTLAQVDGMTAGAVAVVD